MDLRRLLTLAAGCALSMAVAAYPVFAQAVTPAAAQADKADKSGDKKDDKRDEKKDEKKDEKEEPKKPFDKVVKDATAISGLFTLHRTEEKVFLEIKPEQYDALYMLSLTCESGLGERGFYAAQMCGETPVVLHKEGRQVQLVARNPRFTADPSRPISRTVGRSFSDSILATASIESLPHPERKSELVDLGALLLTDLPSMSYPLEATFRIPYKFDAKGSSFGTLKGFDRNVEIETRAHYATERLPVPPPPGEGPPRRREPPPRNVPDPRSLLFTFRYSLSTMPADGYHPRLADDRVGHFFSQAEDFSTDLEHEPARRYINRWRLEKAEPTAALSKPKQPIVFWLENTIPLEYRDAVRDGALMWNAAFERIGFKDAIEVSQQPDDATWDPADVRYNTIRWFTATDAGFAIGPSRANPFTGELYDADISFSEGITRFVRREAIEEVMPVRAWTERPPTAFQPPWSASRFQAACDLPRWATADASFAFDVLTMRGLAGNGKDDDTTEFVRGFLKWVTAHEVGHTLGLRHNFHGSTIHTFEQLQDAKRTGSMGLTNSVMEYIPTNIAGKGGVQGEMFQTTLGPYDYWAVEYAYKPIDAPSPEGELPELRQIAARGSDPLLAYATDEDAGFFGDPYELDPLVNRGDLGSEPLKYYGHRVRLAHELFQNAEGTLLKDGSGYQVLRRSFLQGFGTASYSLYMTSKYIGGIRHNRDHVGDPNGRLPLEPVGAAEQRAALELLKAHLFAPEAFAFSPALLRKLSVPRYPDFTNWETMVNSRKDVPVHTMVLELQTDVLDRLLHPVLLARLLDMDLLLDRDAERFKVATLLVGLQDAIWQDAKPATGPLAINTHRRALQRAHIQRLAALSVGDSKAPDEARSLAREALARLRAQLQPLVARAPSGSTAETRAHLTDSLATIDQVLKPVVQRTGL
jgi:Met-zincin/Domain of unknown function (DUF5117)/Domain of unknown function (DUF5118)